LRLGERDVKGGEDDWEDEGELDHVCPNRCSDVDIHAIGKGPIYPLQPREVCGNWQSRPKIPSHNEQTYCMTSNYTFTALPRRIDGIRVGVTYQVSGHGTTPFSGLLSIEWTEDNSHMCPY
jgi:hypothetical protein